MAKRGSCDCRSDGPAESVQAVAQATSAASAKTLVMVPEICIDDIILLSENYMRVRADRQGTRQGLGRFEDGALVADCALHRSRTA